MKDTARYPISRLVEENVYEYRLGKRKRKRDETKGDGNLVDRISALPDELLYIIVASLLLKEAMATSVLSRRWRNIWKCKTNLDFSDVGRGIHSFLQLKPQEKALISWRYVDCVNRVVEQYTNPTVERFRVCFIIDHRFTNDIDRWIRFAMNKSVQILELEFYADSGGSMLKTMYPFPHNLLALAKESLSLQSGGHHIGFKFLKVLNFRRVDVTREVLEFFLSDCTVLERLTVNAANNLEGLSVTGSSTALKHLVLINCFHLDIIEVRDSNLVSLYFSGVELKNLHLTNVPFLVEVSYITLLTSIELPFQQLSSCLSQLEILKINIDWVAYNRNIVLPILANLKHLELKVDADCLSDLCNLIHFMKVSPCLQRLVLKMDECFLTVERNIGNNVDFPRHYLKVVELVGYRGSDSHVQHVMYLVQNAVALEKIVIDPVRRWCHPTSEEDREIVEVEAENKARNHAEKHLREKVPSTVKFVCL